MEFFKNLELTPVKVAKIVGLSVVGVFVLALALSLLGSSVRSLGLGMHSMGDSIGMPDIAMVEGPYYGKAADVVRTEVSYDSIMPELSIRNILPPMPGRGTSGSDAEEYEVSDYSASIEARDKRKVCGTILDLKALPYVIFESANESETSCYYSFKVEHKHVDEILAVVKDLNPRDLSENTYTIKNQVEDFTSEMEILEKKLDSIDETLSGALDAYDEITNLATRTGDADALAQVVSSKIAIIERLTEERLSASGELERLAREKARQLDRLDYSYISVSIYENKYLDGEALRDSWKAAVQDFVYAINRAIQDATLNLVGLVFIAIPYLLYLFILLIAAKYGWKLVRRIWKQ